MREIEARWLSEQLSMIPARSLSPILEIGSSSLAFRTRHKPHIEKLVHAPLRARGIRIVTTDLRAEEGVEIVGDVFDPLVQKRMRAIEARTLMMCNLFEHLEAPQKFAELCRDLLSPGGRIIVTVPYDYPYHLDPIDTMFRPDPDALHAMFPGTTVERAAILTDGGTWTDLRATRSRTGAVIHIGAELLRAGALRGGTARARSRFAKLRYIGRPYRISAVILSTPTQQEKE